MASFLVIICSFLQVKVFDHSPPDINRSVRIGNRWIGLGRQVGVPLAIWSNIIISILIKYNHTRSLGALRAPTSRLITSFTPFGRSGRVTHATKISFDDDDDDFALIKQRDCLRGAAPGGERQRETRDPLHTRFLWRGVQRRRRRNWVF